MTNKSPLRYPGGKTRAIKILTEIIEKNFPERTKVLSPFLGGGSFELHLCEKGLEVIANDLFVPLYTFWSVMKSNPNELAEKVKKEVPVSKERFHLLREEIQKTQDPMEMASMYYTINRCSFSGSTFCGGFSKQSADGRMTDTIIENITKADLRNLTLTNLDCCEFLENHPEYENTVVYADPPYYITNYIYGRDGDLHESFDHKAFAEVIKKRKDYIISYNDCEYIRNLYEGCRIEEVSWSYGMNKDKKSSEIIIMPSI